MRRIKSISLYATVSILLILADRATKLWAVNNVDSVTLKAFVDGLASFILVKNEGAAFGMGAGRHTLFITIAVVVIVIIVVWLLVKRHHGLLEVLSLSLISAGAIGNVIDRIQYGYVVDFIKFDFINFPVFNFADICVCVGVFLFIIAMILEIVRDHTDSVQ
ncbi:MAG: signal peptidase II [Coriobacteriales bacterium]|nr:signal peptidase II [Coriobacteriales bacterium]